MQGSSLQKSAKMITIWSSKLCKQIQSGKIRMRMTVNGKMVSKLADLFARMMVAERTKK